MQPMWRPLSCTLILNLMNKFEFDCLMAWKPLTKDKCYDTSSCTRGTPSAGFYWTRTRDAWLMADFMKPPWQSNK